MQQEFIDTIAIHQPIILKVCRMYCTEKDDREDLFQEIVLQLWRSYPSFKGEAKISTWMYRISINTAITSLRKNSRKPVTQALSTEHENINEITEQRIDVEYARELQLAINILSKIDKALVMLYLEEKSYKEIAEILGISESNVGVKINRIKKKLQELIKP